MKNIVSPKRTLSVHQEHELLVKLETAGLTKKDAQRVINSKRNQVAGRVIEAIRSDGRQPTKKGSSWRMTPYTFIDCDLKPAVPEGFRIKDHRKMGQLEWDPAKIRLFQLEVQQRKFVKAAQLYKRLDGAPVLNACALDLLKCNNEYIPSHWEEKVLYFFGTLYSDPDGEPCVGRLYYQWEGPIWQWGYVPLAQIAMSYRDAVPLYLPE